MYEIVFFFQDNCVAMAMHLSLFARIMLQNQEFLWSAIQHTANESKHDVGFECDTFDL